MNSKGEIAHADQKERHRDRGREREGAERETERGFHGMKGNALYINIATKRGQHDFVGGPMRVYLNHSQSTVIHYILVNDVSAICTL